jgi:gamma-butyrobetaine dioxygenase
MSAIETVETLADLFAARGERAYLGERVSVATHMLQTGALAQQAGAGNAVVVAALLHDVGHLVAPTSHETDAHHEVTGADWLTALGFPPSVTEPVRLHVAAKRFLCAVEPAYLEALSPASVQSLRLQGGPMKATEVEGFRELQYAEAAVTVRRCDDAAKDPQAPTPAFSEFRAVLESVLR